MHPFADTILASALQLAQMNFDETPALQFLGTFRRELCKEFTAHQAEMLACRIQVKLPPGCLSTEQLDEIALHYATIMAKMRRALVNQGFESPLDALLHMATQFNLVLE